MFGTFSFWAVIDVIFYFIVYHKINDAISLFTNYVHQMEIIKFNKYPDVLLALSELTVISDTNKYTYIRIKELAERQSNQWKSLRT